jgi:pyridoxal phosphate enzyme (YggS family)
MDLSKVCLVTKGRALTDVLSVLAEHPQIKMIGENFYPDCLEKFTYFKEKGYECHFLGRLQKNKLAKIVGVSDVVQSVDSLEVLQKINELAARNSKVVKVFIQVNLGDTNKSGVQLADLEAFFQNLKHHNLPAVKIVGLMTIGFLNDLEKTAKGFALLKQKFDFLRENFSDFCKLEFLSMGMTNDFDIALVNGANLLRLGSYFFPNK